jgi:hypothetical protein
MDTKMVERTEAEVVERLARKAAGRVKVQVVSAVELGASGVPMAVVPEGMKLIGLREEWLREHFGHGAAVAGQSDALEVHARQRGGFDAEGAPGVTPPAHHAGVVASLGRRTLRRPADG